jgi:hypothetical protein
MAMLERHLYRHIMPKTGKCAEGVGMCTDESFYFGNAAVDQMRGSGWFVGQFVPAARGLRHQIDVEVKWGIHRDGEKRPHPWANGNATTISVLIHGKLRATFHIDGTPHVVTLQKEGDYVIFGPNVVHSWAALGDTVVLSVRFPSIEIGRTPELANGG